MMTALAAGITLTPDGGVPTTDPRLLFDPTTDYLGLQGNLFVGPTFSVAYAPGTLTVQPSNNYMSFYGHVDLGGFGAWNPLHSRVAVRADDPAEGSGVGPTSGLFSLVTAGVAEARFSTPVIGETNLTAACGGVLTFGVNSANDGGATCYDHVNDVEIAQDHTLVLHKGLQMQVGLRPLVGGNMTAALAECPQTAAILQNLLTVLSNSQQIKIITNATQ